MKYRELEKGEEIKEGDEWWNEKKKKWLLSDNWKPDSWYPLVGGNANKYRRPIKVGNVFIEMNK